MFELTVTVKDSESKLKRDFLIYDTCYVCEDDPVIRDCIDTTLKEFGKATDDIKLKITMEVE